MRTQQMAIESVIFADARRDFNEAMRRLFIEAIHENGKSGINCSLRIRPERRS